MNSPHTQAQFKCVAQADNGRFTDVLSAYAMYQQGLIRDNPYLEKIGGALKGHTPMHTLKGLEHLWTGQRTPLAVKQAQSLVELAAVLDRQGHFLRTWREAPTGADPMDVDASFKALRRFRDHVHNAAIDATDSLRKSFLQGPSHFPPAHDIITLTDTLYARLDGDSRAVGLAVASGLTSNPRKALESYLTHDTGIAELYLHARESMLQVLELDVAYVGRRHAFYDIAPTPAEKAGMDGQLSTLRDLISLEGEYTRASTLQIQMFNGGFNVPYPQARPGEKLRLN